MHVLVINLTTIAIVLMAGFVQAQETIEPLSLPPTASDLPATTSDEEPQALTRGPLHEAFAEVYAEPEPGLTVEKEPPEPIDEIPPSHRPDGDDVDWIPGYWGWDEDRQDFLWISGVWRKVPPGRNWVPGYWQKVDDGRQWISGFWRSSGRGDIEYLPTPPPTAESGPSSPAPSDNHFYIPGCWRYVDEAYRWRPGFWNLQNDDWMWIPHRYVWTQRGCIFRNGYWDYLPRSRGVLFAPVQFGTSLSRLGSYRYTPNCVIDVGPSLLVHLFVRPSYCHYYFGDYYAAQYRQSRIYPWVTCWQRHRHYDPLFAYYYYHTGRRNSVINRVQGWHNHFQHHQELRPAHRFVDQHRRRNQGTVTQVASLGRSFQSELQRSKPGRGFVRVDRHNLEQIRGQVKPLKEIGRLRATVESRIATSESTRSSVVEQSTPLPGRRDPVRRNRRSAQRDASGTAIGDAKPSSDASTAAKNLRQELNNAIGDLDRRRTARDRQPLRSRNQPRSLDQLTNRLREGNRPAPSDTTVRQDRRRESTSRAVDRLRSQFNERSRSTAEFTRRSPATVTPQPIPRSRSFPQRANAPNATSLRRPATTGRRPSGLNVAPRASARPAPRVRATQSPRNSIDRARAATPSRGGASFGTNRGTSSSRSFGGNRGASPARNLGGNGNRAANPGRSFGSNRRAGSARSFGGAGSGASRSRARERKPERNR